MLALCRSLKSPEGKHRHCVYHQSNNRKAKKRNRKPENTINKYQEVWRAGAKCAARAGPTDLLKPRPSPTHFVISLAGISVLRPAAWMRALKEGHHQLLQ